MKSICMPLTKVVACELCLCNENVCVLIGSQNNGLCLPPPFFSS